MNFKSLPVFNDFFKNTVNQSPSVNATNKTSGHMTQANHPLILVDQPLFNVLLSFNIPKYISLELHATKVLS